MNKKILIFGLILALSLGFMACSEKDDNNASFAGKEQIILEKYPQARNISWKKSADKKYDIAVFTLPQLQGNRVVMWFGYNDNIRLVDQEILFNELPDAVSLSFGETKCNPVKGISDQTLLHSLYSDAKIWRIDDINRIERDGVLSYKIELESLSANDVEVELFYDPQGLLLKEAEDKDEEEEIPLEIPASIKEWIAAHYDNAEVINYESEREDGVLEHELDLKIGRIIIEITLLEKNGTLQLGEEESNYPDLNALPADIKTEVEKVVAAQSVVAAENIDDIEMIRRNGAEIYVIGFEKRDDEYKLRITRNADSTITTGNIVRES